MSVMINIEKECPFCGKKSTLSVVASDYHAWQRGLQIQYAFPDLSPFYREILQSGICISCQEYIFGKPAPENEEEWGEYLGECVNCGKPIYSKHNAVEGRYQCDSCYITMLLDEHTGSLLEEM